MDMLPPSSKVGRFYLINIIYSFDTHEGAKGSFKTLMRWADSYRRLLVKYTYAEVSKKLVHRTALHVCVDSAHGAKTVITINIGGDQHDDADWCDDCRREMFVRTELDYYGKMGVSLLNECKVYNHSTGKILKGSESIHLMRGLAFSNSE